MSATDLRLPPHSIEAEQSLIGGLLLDGCAWDRVADERQGLDLIVVDYIGLMSGQGDNRTQQLGAISRGLKALAKELEVPIIALAQLNRGAENRQDKRPMLSDLRDSGEIEQDADIVAMLHRESIYNSAPEWAGVAELLVRKNRHGPAGDVLLSWYPNETRFADHHGPNPRRQSAPEPAAKGFK
jgi:replicative DNA helicase